MKLTLDQLSKQAELPVRTIRYYIQTGLLPAPEGQKRGAWYTSDHLAALLRIRQWREAGLSLEAIGDLLAAKTEAPVAPARPGTLEVRSHFIVAEGVEVVVAPDRAGLSQQQLRQLFRTLEEALRELALPANRNTNEDR